MATSADCESEEMRGAVDVVAMVIAGLNNYYNNRLSKSIYRNTSDTIEKHALRRAKAKESSVPSILPKDSISIEAWMCRCHYDGVNEGEWVPQNRPNGFVKT